MNAGTVAGIEAAGRKRGRRLGRILLALVASLIGCSLWASSAMALSPSVGSKAASNVDYSTATFNGTVNPNGLETKTYFEYGPTVSYGSKTAEVSAGAGSSALEIAKAVTGLTANTTYHYRVVATNADGTSTGGDRTFTVGWKVESLSEVGTQMKDVSCTSPSACTAVQDSGIQRWNGSAWNAQTLATPAGGSSVTAQAVSCPSAEACVAVGTYVNASSELKTLAEVWNGSEWKVQTSPTPASFIALRSISCPSAGECTAVGSSGGGNKTFAMRWNGSEWSLQTTVNAGEETHLKSVSCVSSSFCMATGFYYEASAYIPFAERWNGTEWSTKAPAKPAGATLSWLYGVSCVSSNACWGVGYKEVNAGTHETQTMVQFWNGSSWALQTSPNPEAVNRNLEDVSCTSLVACTAVGNLTGSLPFGLKWDGNSWTIQNLPLASGSTKASVFSTSCVLSRGCVAVGQKWNAKSEVVRFAEDNWRPAMPTVTTTAASSVGEKSATLNGTANPNGTETKVYFEYGTSISYGSKTAEFNLGSGSSAIEASAPITGLSPATTYHYRIAGNNENPEASRGSDQTLRTSGPPTVWTFTANVDNATGEAATLTGEVNPNGLSTTYQFEYGTSSGTYTNTVPVSPESAGSGTESKVVSTKATGLTRGKTYYYRITATNSAGKSNGPETSFTLPDVPGATTSAATGITRKCATLKGVVVPNMLTTNYWFEYGTTTSYGTKVPLTAKEVGAFVPFQSVEESACGLASSTLYHFRLVAQNGLGTTNGSDQTFTTLPAVTLLAKGTPLEAKAPLKAFSSNLIFNVGGLQYSCTETEFAGSVTENPGAVQSVSTAKMQNGGGAACAWVSGPTPTAKIVLGTSGMTMEYATNGAGEGVVSTSAFSLNATYTFVFFGVPKISGECEYSVQLGGPYVLKEPLTSTLSGEAKLVKTIFGNCPSGEMSGTFAVTSSGTAVEAQ